MCGKCNYLAKLRPLCAPAADHKTSSYSVSSTAVPGGLGVYGSLWPSGLCQSQHTGRKAVTSLRRSGKEQRCRLQLKAKDCKYQGLKVTDLIVPPLSFFPTQIARAPSSGKLVLPSLGRLNCFVSILVLKVDPGSAILAPPSAATDRIAVTETLGFQMPKNEGAQPVMV